jgi:hypothetical protein
LGGYAEASKQSNLFFCPGIKGKRTDFGVRWDWKFDCHKVSYGYNGFFLGIHPYTAQEVNVAGIKFTTAPWFKRNSIVSPAENLLIGDSMPKSDGFWASSLWWPAACMLKNSSKSGGGYEGIDPNRHFGSGVAVFNDGHSEPRKNLKINPHKDPYLGGNEALINAEFWDPLQRNKLKTASLP